MSQNRERLRRLALMGAFAAALCSVRCNISDGSNPQVYFDVQVPDSLLAYARVVVLLKDSSGNLIDTLYAGAMTSTGALSKLPVPEFQAGAPVQLEILGLRGDSAVFQQTRWYNPVTQLVLPPPPPSASTASSTSPAGVAAGFGMSPGDTSVYFGDSIVYRIVAPASATPPVRVLWDGNGDGIWDDSIRPDPAEPNLTFGFRAGTAAAYAPRARLYFASGDSLTLQGLVTVSLNAPTADAGPDTTVPVGGVILLHAGGTSAVRAIAARAWQVNGGDFWSVPWENTTYPAPATPGAYTFVLRITDTDSLTAQDTMVVAVTSSSAPSSTTSP